MITTLTGTNDYAIKMELEKIKNKFIASYGELGISYFDSDNFDAALFNEALNNQGLLASSSLIIARDLTDNKDFSDLVNELSELDESTQLVIIAPSIDKRTAIYKYLNKNSEYKEFSVKDSNNIAAWLVKQAEELGAELTQANANYLITRLGSNQLYLLSELNKLAIYSQSVTKENIDLLTEATPQADVFELLEAVFRGSFKRAVSIYEDLRRQSEEPPKILGMFVWQLNNLALVKTAGNIATERIASESKQRPFSISKSASVAKSISIDKLKAAIKELLDLDVALKSRKIDADQAIINFMLKFS